MNASAVLHTPFRDVLAMLDVFLALRKAQGMREATIANYRHILGPFFQRFPSFLEEPRAAVLEYLGEPAPEWTRFTRIRCLKTFSAFLIEEGHITQNPMRGIKNPIPDQKKDAPAVAEVKAFLDALDQKSFAQARLRVVILLALDTGLRRGEVCALQRSDVDLEGCTVRVAPETCKTRRERRVPISPAMARELRRFLATFPPVWKTTCLFPTEKGTPIQPGQLGQQVRRLAQKNGTPLCLHGLRHLCATQILRETGNLALTAKMLGHSSIKTTAQFYEHLSLEDLRDAHAIAAPAGDVLPAARLRKIEGKKLK